MGTTLVHPPCSLSFLSGAYTRVWPTARTDILSMGRVHGTPPRDTILREAEGSYTNHHTAVVYQKEAIAR
jgi:hypothetical protein